MIKKQVEWLIKELLNNRCAIIHYAIIHVVYEKDKAKVYLNGKRIATISEQVSMFNFPLTDEQIDKLAKLCKK